MVTGGLFGDGADQRAVFVLYYLLYWRRAKRLTDQIAEEMNLLEEY
jgi:hypothetical protein